MRPAYAQKYVKPAKRRHVCSLITAVSKYENVHMCYPVTAKNTVWLSGETGAGGLAFCCTRNAKGLREPAGRSSLVSGKLQAFSVRGDHEERCRFFYLTEQRTRETFVLSRPSFNGFCVFHVFSYIYASKCDQPLNRTTGHSCDVRVLATVAMCVCVLKNYVFRQTKVYRVLAVYDLPT